MTEQEDSPRCSICDRHSLRSVCCACEDLTEEENNRIASFRSPEGCYCGENEAFGYLDTENPNAPKLPNCETCERRVCFECGVFSNQAGAFFCRVGRGCQIETLYPRQAPEFTWDGKRDPALERDLIWQDVCIKNKGRGALTLSERREYIKTLG